MDIMYQERQIAPKKMPVGITMGKGRFVAIFVLCVLAFDFLVSLALMHPVFSGFWICFGGPWLYKVIDNSRLNDKLDNLGLQSDTDKGKYLLSMFSDERRNELLNQVSLEQANRLFNDYYQNKENYSDPAIKALRESHLKYIDEAIQQHYNRYI